jgi:hypothetical protein
MKERHVDLPTIALIAGTRVALGIGIGLLLSDRLSPEARSAVGRTLIAVGALSTIPLVAQVFGQDQSAGANLRVAHNPVSPYVTVD